MGLFPIKSGFVQNGADFVDQISWNPGLIAVLAFAQGSLKGHRTRQLCEAAALCVGKGYGSILERVVIDAP